MKKLFKLSALFLSLLTITLFAFACTNEQPEQDFTGRYDSIFIDQQNANNSLSFTLVIKEDNTFTLLRSDSGKTTKGSWTKATIGSTTQLLCYSYDEYDKGNKWYPYFSLSMTDDGKIIASPGTNGISFAFGYTYNGSSNYLTISLIVFEKTI